MPQATPLSHVTIRYTKPKAKPFKLADGLFLVIQPNGGKLWRYRYRFRGVERSLSIGRFPKVTIAEARARREQAKEPIAAGIDPSVQKRLDRIASGVAARNTFDLIADEYIERLEANGASASTSKKTRWHRDILARPLKRRPIADITPAEILDLLQRIERSVRRETARRMRGFIGVNRLPKLTLDRRPELTHLISWRGRRRSPRRSWSGLRNRGERGSSLRKVGRPSDAVFEAPAFVAGFDDIAVMREAVRQ